MLEGKRLARRMFAVQASLQRASRRAQAFSWTAQRLVLAVLAVVTLAAVPKLVGRRPVTNVCLITADFWGHPTAGGTATAFELLALTLAESPRYNVTLVGLFESPKYRDKAHKVHEKFLKRNYHFEYLHPELASFNTTTSHPHEGMALAVYEWASARKCDILHGHEWGGVFNPTLTHRHFGGFRPDLPIMLQLHGGHYWSSLHGTRPMDVMSLRMDGQEKQALELAEIAMAPSSYMMSWYRQRGWKLTPNALMLPNVIEAPDTAGNRPKKITRLTFWGRLEERKGLKLFVDALEMLPADVTTKPGFEVVFIGGNAEVDGMKSTAWLEQRTANLSLPYRTMINLPRDEAIEVIKGEGHLLVLCTQVENAPYVVAEASVLNLPYVVFSVGGVEELIISNSDYIVPFYPQNKTATSIALAHSMALLMRKGEAIAAPLRPSYASGAKQWMDWHESMVKRPPLHRRAQEVAALTQCSPLAIYPTHPKLAGMDLHHQVCASGGGKDDTVLLLPPSHGFNESGAWQGVCRFFEQDFKGAVTFGAWVKYGLAAYANSPTWTYYEGYDPAMKTWGDRCSYEIPVMLKRHTFCSSYLAEARDFPYYSSWALTLFLKQLGQDVLTHPAVLFNTLHWPNKGSSCLTDSMPDFSFTHDIASNLKGEAQYMLIEQLVPRSEPLADLARDIKEGSTAPERHWTFGSGPSPLNITPFQALRSGSGVAPLDILWGCPGGPGGFSYFPNFHQLMLHSCSADEDEEPLSCCGQDTAPAHVVFESWFRLSDVSLALTYDVQPECGDGLTVTLTHVRGPHSINLHTKSYPPANTSTRVELFKHHMQFDASDRLVLSSYSGANHDCDGVFIPEWKLFRSSAAFAMNIGN